MIDLDTLVSYSAQVMILTATAAIAMKALRLRDPRTRLLFFQGILAGTIVLPWLEKWAPQAQESGEVIASLTSWSASTRAAAHGANLQLLTWVVPFLVIGAAFRLVWLASGLLRLNLLRRHATHIENRGTISIYTSEQISGPVTYGIFRPTILMPHWLVGNAAILRHELIHIARRDWLWQFIEELIKCALWFHPAVWWLTGEIELAREQVVDAETVAATGECSRYVHTLVDVAASKTSRRAALAPAFSTTSSLRRRVEMLLTEHRESRRRLLCSSALIVLCIAGATWQSVCALPLYFTDHPADGSKQQKNASATDQKEGDTTKPIRVSADKEEKLIVKKVTPKYTVPAKTAGIQGTVILDITISKEGHVTTVTPISGPSELIDSAVEAVKQWEFRPTLLNGNPVEVMSDVHVNYTLAK
jgi:TonB family protein